ncbi:hypothetical protein Pmar_PMAR004048 [Perkinsus marinus ATCC 50983]|uniref:Uncharacterized protein n=1 Tax=Perkinsus marinus (strain ATCC 50983 / TXsc) TaxID=423536 RepID=C5LZI3_PERM5|nr:hypothetical protein Pmar_PMAR004048 [Perkinsus marinus ATCC 50983]EEQ97850.1 hypothetical protein Pmar_PMAR004048 [Perkinsus marinus ATCC 50983]|eukprot:XP_002765133.1 hypothetical protein Pmar_PMAR004048 [Perkinsus marinus ATCC 50983]
MHDTVWVVGFRGLQNNSPREVIRKPRDASMARRLLSEKLGVERDLLVFMTSTEANTLIDSVDDLSTRLALRRMMGRSAQPPTQGPVYHAELPVGSKTGPVSTVSFDRLYNDSQDHRSDVKTMTAIGELPIPGDKVFQGRDDARSVSNFCRELALTGQLYGLNSETMFRYVLGYLSSTVKSELYDLLELQAL